MSQHQRPVAVAEHVQAVISSCAQTLYVLRILRAHGMDDSDLQTIYRSVVIANTLPVPGGVLPVLLIGKDSMRSSDEASVVT